ncbi:hypothetical protein ACOME3_008872 [Neoechinorhynchus agilis]
MAAMKNVLCSYYQQHYRQQPVQSYNTRNQSQLVNCCTATKKISPNLIQTKNESDDVKFTANIIYRSALQIACGNRVTEQFQPTAVTKPVVKTNLDRCKSYMFWKPLQSSVNTNKLRSRGDFNDARNASAALKGYFSDTEHLSDRRLQVSSGINKIGAMTQIRKPFANKWPIVDGSNTSRCTRGGTTERIPYSNSSSYSRLSQIRQYSGNPYDRNYCDSNFNVKVGSKYVSNQNRSMVRTQYPAAIGTTTTMQSYNQRVRSDMKSAYSSVPAYTQGQQKNFSCNTGAWTQSAVHCTSYRKPAPSEYCSAYFNDQRKNATKQISDKPLLNDPSSRNRRATSNPIILKTIEPRVKYSLLNSRARQYNNGNSVSEDEASRSFYNTQYNGGTSYLR